MFVESINALPDNISKKLCKTWDVGTHYLADGFFYENQDSFIIFLDIDGVLNTVKEMNIFYKMTKEEARAGKNDIQLVRHGDFYHIPRLKLFEELCAKYEKLCVVNISSWLTSSKDIIELEDTFVNIPYLVNGLSTGGGYSRAAGILPLIDALGAKDRYLIIDDQSIQYYLDSNIPESNIIHVKDGVGLTKNHIQYAEEFIESKINF